ncbi:hypothetical protein BZA77DRAFT_386741 [Pyronema omphalodes]|nr:hypothetical protein BZA77DRAFT_386741 [Pyronema omphalodes]
MAISIRLPSESSTPPHYRYRQNFLSPRIWRRILPVVLVFFLLVESYRFLSAGAHTATPSDQQLLQDAGAIIPSPGTGPGASTAAATADLDLGPPLTQLKTLVIVACHAIWLGGPTAGKEENEWVLESYQRGRNEQIVWGRHIEAGVKAAQEDEGALLVFSGGETRPGVGPRMEGGSYFDLAVARGLIDAPLLNRTTTELVALDSYQNLLFSLLRFHELTGSYPEHITLVSYAFKKSRFVDSHLAAIKYPETRFTFIGIDPEGIAEEEMEKIKLGEGKTREMWGKDPYACHEGGLRGKRRHRNGGRRGWGYKDTVKEQTHVF